MTVIVTDLLSRLGGKIWKVFGKSWLWSFRNIWLIWELLPISKNWCNHYLRIVIVRRGAISGFWVFLPSISIYYKIWSTVFFILILIFLLVWKFPIFFNLYADLGRISTFFLRFCHPLFVNPSSQFTILTEVLITSSLSDYTAT